MGRSKQSSTSETSVKKDSPKSRGRKKETRGKILNAARHIFSNFSYYTASIRMIGKLAEVEHPLISYYFPNKAALFVAVVEEVIDKHTKLEREWLKEIASMPTVRCSEFSASSPQKLGDTLPIP